MSFRKRSEILNNPNRPVVPGRGTRVGATETPGVPGRAPPIPARGGLGRPVPGLRTPARPVGRPAPAATEPVEAPELTNPGIRPSILTSQPTISTGTADLDKILGHQGLPLGNSLLVEESGSTDFGSIILRCFASQGFMHNRIENSKEKNNCHVVVVGLSVEWLKELPGLYKGSSKDKKKALINSNESKINVSNLAQASQERDLKIAWRYGLNKKVAEENLSEVNENYNYQFDITERIKPLPSAQEVSFIPLANDYKKLILNISNVIQQQLKTNPSKTVRIIMPNLLIPSIYPPSFSQSTVIIPFIHALRALLKSYQNNVALIFSLPLDLYPRSTTMTTVVENLADSVIHLQPFNQAMTQLIEKAYKNEPSKVQHGLVHILKLPVLSERGSMTIHQGEFAFKNGRKKFEIEEWGIPVEDDSNDKEETHNLNPAHQHQHHPNHQEKQTKHSIDF